MPPVDVAADTAGQQEGGTLPGECSQASGQEPVETIDSALIGARAAGWQQLLGEAIRDVGELWRVLALPPAMLPAARAAAGTFRLLVPRGFVARMRMGDVTDPLLRQIVPLGDELAEYPGFTADPLAEGSCAPAPGLLHKYDGRALLVVTGACAVHCRYCFRRHYPYDELPRGRQWWQPAVEYLRGETGVREVLLSGGDPLTLPDAQLRALAADLATIPHLQRLRIHTRLPVVLPERITEEFLAWFTGGRLAPVMVIHANHPAEISPAVIAACAKLRAAGVMLLSQSVLLRGVNDVAQVLIDLSEALFAAGVVPYYLHLLDRVQGAGHFLVADDEARQLMQEVAAHVPGYLVPRLVRELPGAPGKTPVIW